ncbi:hypothetical protein ARMGADRAFT_862875, partial [Armillaria gallica]
TNHRLGALPFVIGMPVMITQNFNVEGEIMNGSTGILHKVQYCLNEDGEHVALSCIVHVPLMMSEPLSLLQNLEAVALQDTVDM